jgi:hypothetical protein
VNQRGNLSSVGAQHAVPQLGMDSEQLCAYPYCEWMAAHEARKS